MPLIKFLYIIRFFHFTNNNIINNIACLYKRKFTINFLNHKFKKIYTMKKNIDINKLLMRFKECILYKQFNLIERIRWH